MVFLIIILDDTHQVGFVRLRDFQFDQGFI